MESGTLIGMTKLVMGEVRVKVEYHVNGQIGERSNTLQVLQNPPTKNVQRCPL